MKSITLEQAKILINAAAGVVFDDDKQANITLTENGDPSGEFMRVEWEDSDGFEFGTTFCGADNAQAGLEQSRLWLVDDSGDKVSLTLLSAMDAEAIAASWWEGPEPAALRTWSVDEVAECLPGVTPDTYTELWDALGKAHEAGKAKPLGGDGSDGTVEEPIVSSGAYASDLAAAWPTLSVAARANIFQAAERHRPPIEDEDPT